MHTALLSISYGPAKTVALLVIGGLIVVALLIAKLMSNVSRKTVVLLIFAGLSLGVWAQRQSLQKCADDARSIADGRVATCRFFGNDIMIEAPSSG